MLSVPSVDADRVKHHASDTTIYIPSDRFLAPACSVPTFLGFSEMYKNSAYPPKSQEPNLDYLNQPLEEYDMNFVFPIPDPLTFISEKGYEVRLEPFVVSHPITRTTHTLTLQPALSL
jgi:hypothetical protein